MGMSSGNSGGVRNDINVTPLVDIMLVLLVIFMVTTPMMSKGANVSLPEGTWEKSGKECDEKKEITVAWTIEHQIWLNQKVVQIDQLPALVRQELETRSEKHVLLKADRDAEYDAILELVDAIREGSAQNVTFVITRPHPEDKAHS